MAHRLRVDDASWERHHFRVCVDREPNSTKMIVDGLCSGSSVSVWYLVWEGKIGNVKILYRKNDSTILNF